MGSETENDTAKQQAEADRLDAERYRFLRARKGWHYSRPPMRAITASFQSHATPEELDKAIDHDIARIKATIKT